MRLIQMPFSHNCIKVRRALELKGLAYETLDIRPQDRRLVIAKSGQKMVPALEDGDHCVAGSTAVLRYLEQAYPEPSLLPEDRGRDAECWLIVDWADRTFMELTRRLAYWQRLHSTPDVLARRFFPEARGFKLWIMMRVARSLLIRRFGLSASRNEKDEVELPRAARLALDRLAGRPRFFGERTTVADVALASMVGPAYLAAEHVRRDDAVRELLLWASSILGDAVMRLYDPPDRDEQE
jgi:glutathione S-transferase